MGILGVMGSVLVTLISLGIAFSVGWFALGMWACGGFDSPGALVILLPVVGAVFYGVFCVIKSTWSNNGKDEVVAITPATNKYQKAVVDYIVQARTANLSDQSIHSNLYGAGWTPDDINFGFEAVGGKK